MSTMPPPPPPPVSPFGVAGPTTGRPPESLGGVFYSKPLNILLVVVTCGVWAAVWAWRTHEDLRTYTNDGLGGVAALIITLLVSPVIMFMTPYEIQRMYERDGRQSPVTTIWGLWFLLPIIGNLIWYLKVQSALNDFWLSKGSRPA